MLLYPMKHHTVQCTREQRHSSTHATCRWVVILIPADLPHGNSLQYGSRMKLGKIRNQYEWCRVETNLLPVTQSAFRCACGSVYKTALSRLHCFSSKLKVRNWPASLQFGLWVPWWHCINYSNWDDTITTVTELQAAHQKIRVQFLAGARDLTLLHSLQIGSVDHPALYSIHNDSTFSGDKAAGAGSWHFTSLCWS